MDGGLVARVVILTGAIAESAIETVRLSMEDALVNESVLRHTPPVAYGYPPGVPGQSAFVDGVLEGARLGAIALALSQHSHTYCKYRTRPL